jgi:tetrahydromethanopterin S-methyltransferase subunit H
MATDRGNQHASGLFVFGAEQKTYEVGNIRIGGQPGAQPTALIGTIFYHGHDLFTDEDRDEFDTSAALVLIREQEDFSTRTGNPCLMDVVGATPEAIVRHLEFVAGVTEMPLLIDGTTSDVRMAGLEFVAKAGLADRIVYNSIQPEIDDEELQAIQKAGVTCAIVLTYNMMDFTTEGRVDSVRKLLPKLEEAGITKPIVDTCVLDMATLGQALSAMHIVKDQFGLPVGAGVHNAVAIWRGLKEKMGKQAKAPCLAACVAISVASGADFALYGPIEDANIVFPAIAMTDTALSQIAMDRGIMLDKETHPRFRIG